MDVTEELLGLTRSSSLSFVTRPTWLRNDASIDSRSDEFSNTPNVIHTSKIESHKPEERLPAGGRRLTAMGRGLADPGYPDYRAGCDVGKDDRSTMSPGARASGMVTVNSVGEAPISVYRSIPRAMDGFPCRRTDWGARHIADGQGQGDADMLVGPGQRFRTAEVGSDVAGSTAGDDMVNDPDNPTTQCRRPASVPLVHGRREV
jgi:hypothetical protein